MAKFIPIVLLYVCACVSAADYYASTLGSAANPGTFALPWTLQYALTNATPQPGDTIHVRGGTYTGHFESNIAGDAEAQITVRAYNAERVTLDGAGSGDNPLTVYGDYTTWRGLELMDSDSNPDRTNQVGNAGIYFQGINCNVINLIVHDAKANGILAGADATNFTATGCIVYNNGYEQPDRGHGHGFYLQGANPNLKIITGNVSFNNYAISAKAYAEGPDIDGFRFVANTFFGSGKAATNYYPYNLQIGGLSMTHNVQVVQNRIYSPPASSTHDDFWMVYGVNTNGDLLVSSNYVAGGGAAVKYWTNGVVTNNIFILGGNFQIADGFGGGTGYTVDYNTYYWPFARPTPFYKGVTAYNFADWKTATGYDANSASTDAMPTGSAIFYWADSNEPGRGFITAYNWDLAATIDVDLSQIVTSGHRYEIRNVQNPLGPALYTGIYTSGTVALATSGYTVARPLGRYADIAETGPAFNVWLVTPKSVSTVATVRANRIRGK